MTNRFIVVPEGLSFIEDKTVLSPAFRGSLNCLLGQLRPDDIVFLAPANKFQSECFEQDYAAVFLKNVEVDLTVYTAKTMSSKYVDTLDNAHMLRPLIVKNGFSEKSFTLVVNEIHARRAVTAFKSAGYAISRVIRTRSDKFEHSEYLPCRLFYYRYKFLHVLYECFASVYQLVRIMMRKLF